MTIATTSHALFKGLIGTGPSSEQAEVIAHHQHPGLAEKSALEILRKDIQIAAKETRATIFKVALGAVIAMFALSVTIAAASITILLYFLGGK